MNREPNRLGDSFIFPPHALVDIHIKSEVRRYRMRGLFPGNHALITGCKFATTQIENHTVF